MSALPKHLTMECIEELGLRPFTRQSLVASLSVHKMSLRSFKKDLR